MGYFSNFAIEILNPKYMKKLYTLILSVTLFSGITNAQSTLTQVANEPIVGDFERRKGFDSTTTMVNSTGSNQTWNFTSLTSNTVAATTYSYVTPSTAPGYTASFAAATVAKVTSSVSSDFFKSSANLYEFVASRPSSSLTLTFSNYATIAQWPITNTYSVSDAFSGTIKAVIVLTGTGPFSGVQNVASTGTGTLQLPNGITLNDCMQVTSNFSLTGSVTVFTINATMTITSTGYNYYHSSQKFPVLTINYSTSIIKTGTATPTPQKSVDISINNDVFSGINEFTLNNSYSV